MATSQNYLTSLTQVTGKAATTKPAKQKHLVIKFVSEPKYAWADGFHFALPEPRKHLGNQTMFQTTMGLFVKKLFDLNLASVNMSNMGVIPTVLPLDINTSYPSRSVEKKGGVH